MKNLKKVLSVALALAMALSLMTTAFAAVPKASDLTGNDKVGSTYTQAVDAMVALGVINGVSGDVQAQGNVTREQAAKMICTMLLGDNASALSTTSTYFTDVAATRWSAPYIAYCVENGIVSGVGGGKFNPTGNVTGNQFAKMLLVALGYNAATEGYTGTNWAVNVSGDAADAGIYKSATTLNKNTAATREQACLYAWNAVKATLVEYNTTGTNITIGGTSINVGGSKATPVSSTTLESRGYLNGVTNPVTDASYTVQFGEKYFPTLKLTTTGQTDDFGSPSTTIKLGNTTVGNYASNTVITYTGATKAAVVASDLSGYTITNAHPNPDVDVSVNNTTTYAADAFTSTAIVVKNAAPVTTIASDATYTTVAAVIAHETANGKTVKVFADATGLITKIVEVTYTVGTVSAVTTATSGTTYTLKAANGTTTTTGIDYVDGTDTISFAAAPAKGDVVTYVTVNGTTYVYPTTTVSGVQTAVTTLGVITVGGTNYTIGLGVSNATTNVGVGDFSNSAASVTVSLDQFGYAVKSTAAAASTDYAYVVNSICTLSTTVDGTTPSAQVKAVLANGTVATYTLSLTKVTTASTSNDYTSYVTGSAVTAQNTAVGDYIITGTKIIVYNASVNTAEKAAAAIHAAVNGVIFGYTLSDSTISLQAKVAAGGTMTPGVAYFDNDVDGVGYGITSISTGETAIFSSSTIFVAYNNVKGTATVYTGVSALPTSTATSKLDNCVAIINAVGSAATTGVGTANVVFYNAASSLSADTVNYAYINTANYSTNTVSGSTTYGYTGYLADGTTVTLTTTATMSTPGIYSYTSTDTTAASSLIAAVNVGGMQNTLYTYGTFSLSGSVLTVKTGADTLYYSMNDSSKTVMVNTLLSGVDGNSGYVVLEKNSSGAITGNVATIYVTVAGALPTYALTTTDMTYAGVYSDALCHNNVTSGTSFMAGTKLYAKLSAAVIMDTTKFTYVSGTANTTDAIYSFVTPAAASALPAAYTLTISSPTNAGVYSDSTCNNSVSTGSVVAGTTLYLKLSGTATVGTAHFTLVSGTAGAIGAIYSFAPTTTTTVDDTYVQANT